jgi:hypothetical protein
MRPSVRPTVAWRLCAFALFALPNFGAAARPPVNVPDVSHESARASAAWIRDGVIYEIFPRDFSAGGNLTGVTAQLDRLQQLGVTILWRGSGEVVRLHNSGEGRALTFLRRSPNETILVAINLSSEPFSGEVRGAEGEFHDITPAAAQPQMPARTRGVPPALSLEAWGFRIYRATPGSAP